MKQNQHRAGGRNNRPAQSEQARKTTGKLTPVAPAATEWKPDRAWLREQRATKALLQNLGTMQRPVVIAQRPSDGRYSPDLAATNDTILFAQGSDGKELFFMEHQLFPNNPQREVTIIDRRNAFAIVMMWVTPRCLFDHMLKVLKKGGAM